MPNTPPKPTPRARSGPSEIDPASLMRVLSVVRDRIDAEDEHTRKQLYAALSAGLTSWRFALDEFGRPTVTARVGGKDVVTVELETLEPSPRWATYVRSAA